MITVLYWDNYLFIYSHKNIWEINAGKWCKHTTIISVNIMGLQYILFNKQNIICLLCHDTVGAQMDKSSPELLIVRLCWHRNIKIIHQRHTVVCHVAQEAVAPHNIIVLTFSLAKCSSETNAIGTDTSLTIAWDRVAGSLLYS